MHPNAHDGVRCRPAPPLRRLVRSACVVFAAAATLLLASCSGGNDVERGTDRMVTDVGHALSGHLGEHEESLIDIDGVVNVEVENFAGNVVVRGDRKDRHREVKLLVDRRVTHEGYRVGDMAESLKTIDWTVEISAAPNGVDKVLRIKGTTTGVEPWFQRLDLEILADKLGSVTVDTKRGKVHVYDNRGPVDIVTSKGDVRVATVWPQTAGSSIINKDGAIEWRVRGESAGIIDAQTVGGQVLARCEAGRWNATDPGPDWLVATLNKGENRFTFRTVDGDILISVIGAPHEQGSFAATP